MYKKLGIRDIFLIKAGRFALWLVAMLVLIVSWFLFAAIVALELPIRLCLGVLNRKWEGLQIAINVYALVGIIIIDSIQDLSDQLEDKYYQWEEIGKVMPGLGKWAKPQCITYGSCPEKEPCGRMG